MPSFIAKLSEIHCFSDELYGRLAKWATITDFRFFRLKRTSLDLGVANEAERFTLLGRP